MGSQRDRCAGHGRQTSEDTREQSQQPPLLRGERESESSDSGRALGYGSSRVSKAGSRPLEKVAHPPARCDGGGADGTEGRAASTDDGPDL
jgi:hypothetical protein